MAPSVALDSTSDFASSSPSTATQRILLLAPPSIASHPSILKTVVEAHDRSYTDIHMLDRLALNLVSLPDSTYDVVLLLTDADGTRNESQRILDRTILARVVRALRPGGVIRSQDGIYASAEGQERTEAILAGLIVSSSEDSGMMKPEQTGPVSLSLKFGRKKVDVSTTGLHATNVKRKSMDNIPSRPAGVGFVDFSDDLDTPMIDGPDDDDSDELIDEDDLLTEEDMQRPVMPRKFLRVYHNPLILHLN